VVLLLDFGALGGRGLTLQVAGNEGLHWGLYRFIP
jgi:hypothetical protein